MPRMMQYFIIVPLLLISLGVLLWAIVKKKNPLGGVPWFFVLFIGLQTTGLIAYVMFRFHYWPGAGLLFIYTATASFAIIFCAIIWFLRLKKEERSYKHLLVLTAPGWCFFALWMSVTAMDYPKGEEYHLKQDLIIEFDNSLSFIKTSSDTTIYSKEEFLELIDLENEIESKFGVITSEDIYNEKSRFKHEALDRPYKEEVIQTIMRLDLRDQHQQNYFYQIQSSTDALFEIKRAKLKFLCKELEINTRK